MALQKPILNAITAFDATLNKEYSFDVMGGDAWLGVLITIRDNTVTSTPEIKIFTTTPTNVGIITANSLINGHQYQATIQTTTSSTEAGMTSANTSKASNSVSFNCYIKPTFEFTNIAQDGVVASSMYAFDVAYSQSQGEYLSTYQFLLYDEYDIEIGNSGILEAPEQTITEGVVTCDLVQVFRGFLDGQVRKIVAKGTTINGTQIITDTIRFIVDYSEMERYSEIYAINNCDDGNITVGSALNVVRGVVDKEPVIFYPDEENGTEADLRDNGVTWTNVFDTDNFSVFLQFRAPIEDAPQLILNGFDGKISETVFDVYNLGENIMYNHIVAHTKTYIDGKVDERFDTIYDLSAQQLGDVNYTIDATIYGFMIRRVNSVFSTQLTMLHEPIEALSNYYKYTTEGGTITVEDDGGNITILDGFSATDDGNGNVTLTRTSPITVLDISFNGNIVIGNYDDNGWLTAVYLSDDRGEIPIKFKLGSATEPKNIENLEEGDTYLWAVSDEIDLSTDNFELINGRLYFYPEGKGR